MKEFTLSNNISIPAIGFGTYLATEGSGKDNIIDAIKIGYNYLDTASFYKNETEIGEAIKESGVSRNDLFIASKVWRDELGYEETKAAFERSLARLQTDYLDLYLIHWPRKDQSDKDWKVRMQDTWRAMEELYKEGKIRAIGVSNFLPHHLKVLMETATIKPMINQLELHVGYMQQGAVRYCVDNGILVQAWSPLGRRRVLDEPVVKEYADKYNVPVAKLLLGFLLQQGIAVIPKASSPERLKANLDVWDFEISDEDIDHLLYLPQMGWSGEHPDFDEIF